MCHYMSHNKLVQKKIEMIGRGFQEARQVDINILVVVLIQEDLVKDLPY